MNEPPFMWPYRVPRVSPSVEAPPRPLCIPESACLTPGCANAWCHRQRVDNEQPVLDAEAKRLDAVATNYRLVAVAIGNRVFPTGIVVVHVDKPVLTVEKTTTIKPGTRYTKIARHVKKTIEACQRRSQVTTVMDVTGVGEAILNAITTTLPGRKLRIGIGPTVPVGVRKTNRVTIAAGITQALEAGRLRLPDDQTLIDALDDYQDDVAATRTETDIWRTDGDVLPLTLGIAIWAADKAKPWAPPWRRIPIR